MKTAAGILLYRKTGDEVEVIIVHPSGPYNRRAKWSIPKGELDGQEPAEEAARREVREEIGVVMEGKLIDLGESVYFSKKKLVRCFAAETDAAPSLSSWEIDRAEWVPVAEAKELLHPAQGVFIDRLLESIKA